MPYLSHVVVLAALACVVPSLGAQSGLRAPARSEIIAAARAVAGNARHATFITLDRSGHPQARVVDPFAPDDDLTIWVATNPLSRKAADVAADPRVTLLYFDPASESYLTVIGTARLVRDPVEKAKRWKQEWAGFYKNGNRGDDYLLIRVEPSRLEVVSAAFGLTNDPVTWRPVILDLRP